MTEREASPEPSWDMDRARARSHDYLSTACHHQRHGECRHVCKFCTVACRCDCHHEATSSVGGWEPTSKQTAPPLVGERQYCPAHEGRRESGQPMGVNARGVAQCDSGHGDYPDACDEAEGRSTTPCEHPEEATSPAMLREDARYCHRCKSLVLEDGTTEPVTIRRVR